MNISQDEKKNDKEQAENSNELNTHQKEELDKPVDIKEDNTNDNSQDTKIEKNDAVN